MKRLLFLITTIILVTVFSGCTRLNAPEPKQPQPFKNIPINCNVPTLPIYKEPPTITLNSLKEYNNTYLLISKYDFERASNKVETLKNNCAKYKKVNIAINNYYKTKKIKRDF
jgi:hypothetical protein